VLIEKGDGLVQMKIRDSQDQDFGNRLNRWPDLREKFEYLEAKKVQGGLSKKDAWGLTAEEIYPELVNLESAERRAKEIEAKEEAAAASGECKPHTIGSGMKAFSAKHFDMGRGLDLEEVYLWCARWLWVDDVDYSSSPNVFAAGYLTELRENRESRTAFLNGILPKVAQKSTGGSNSRTGNADLDETMDALDRAYRKAVSKPVLSDGKSEDSEGPGGQ
jgi:hypothetical protein